MTLEEEYRIHRELEVMLWNVEMKAALAKRQAINAAHRTNNLSHNNFGGVYTLTEKARYYFAVRAHSTLTD